MEVSIKGRNLLLSMETFYSTMRWGSFNEEIEMIKDSVSCAGVCDGFNSSQAALETEARRSNSAPTRPSSASQEATDRRDYEKVDHREVGDPT